MDFFNVLSLFGGLAFFLFGMNYMGDGLAKLTGGRMERTLERMTSGRIRAVALGAGVTAVIQSSSATTVMVVGFVNSGIMKLKQAVGVIFGANIGTTLTAWIFSLSGIDSGNFWIKMLKPSSFAPIVAVIGIILILFSKKDGKKDAGSIMVRLLTEYDREKAGIVVKKEKLADRYEDELGSYLVRLNARGLSGQDSKTVSKLLNCIGDLERISDHSLNLKEAAQEMHDKGLRFSERAAAELAVFTGAVKEILAITLQAFVNDDKREAALVEPLEEVIDMLNDELKMRHVDRLKNGECTIELGFVLSDVTTNYERIADHCSNIAVCVLQTGEGGFEAHGYLGKMKSDDVEFKLRYEEYKKKYGLPECD